MLIGYDEIIYFFDIYDDCNNYYERSYGWTIRDTERANVEERT